MVNLVISVMVSWIFKLMVNSMLYGSSDGDSMINSMVSGVSNC